jgi:hypothetical protein
MSNTRFTPKNPDGKDVSLRLAVINYFEHGGKITVCKPGRRSKANTSFPMTHGTVANMGAKAVNLKNIGTKSRRG